MKLRTLVAGAVIAGFLSGVPIFVRAQEHPGWGDYDEHHQWHPGNWWLENHPNWAREHHPEWAKRGDWDEHHHWHDRDWWKGHRGDWARKHHPDWF
jgi:hypothetical protein